ncbi:MAG: enoyl-CoA hydratase/isomerase family protein [Alicyclobacillus sp.]|nr:enoyl-CoA hydratase/isomerase family protein [Alicyclobacillus sp.]
MITLDTRGFVSTITIRREEKLNAITPEMAVELAHIVDQVNDSDCRVVVLTGGSKVFSAGSDIKALDHYPTAWDYRVRKDDYTRSIRRIRKPVIAMISGYCLGGGLEMALQSDIRYASTDAKFGAPEVTWGWIGGGGASQILPRLIGFGRAMELLVTGRTISADEAYQIGLVNRVLAPHELEEATYALAEEIAKRAPIAVQVIKQAVRMSMNIGLDQGLDYENELVHITFSTQDKEEGVRAFREKRQPNFTGR